MKDDYLHSTRFIHIYTFLAASIVSFIVLAVLAVIVQGIIFENRIDSFHVLFMIVLAFPLLFVARRCLFMNSKTVKLARSSAQDILLSLVSSSPRIMKMLIIPQDITMRRPPLITLADESRQGVPQTYGRDSCFDPQYISFSWSLLLRSSLNWWKFIFFKSVAKDVEVFRDWHDPGSPAVLRTKDYFLLVLPRLENTETHLDTDSKCLFKSNTTITEGEKELKSEDLPAASAPKEVVAVPPSPATGDNTVSMANSTERVSHARPSSALPIVLILLASTGYCMYFLFLALADVARIEETQSWPIAPGTIVASETQKRIVSKSGKKETEYIPIVKYAYTVAEKNYTGERISLANSVGPARLTKELAEWKLKTYPVGKDVSVHYNPAHPSIAVLETTPPPGMKYELATPIYRLLREWGFAWIVIH